MATAGSPGLGPARSGRSCPDLGLKRGGETGSWSQKLGGERAAEPGGDSLFALPLALPHCHIPWAVQNPEPAGAMLRCHCLWVPVRGRGSRSGWPAAGWRAGTRWRIRWP